MQDPKLSSWQRLTALLLPPLVVLCLAVLLFDAVQRRRQVTAEVEQTYETVGLLNHLQARLVDAESGQRGFVVTGQEADLAPYQGSARDVWSVLAQLRQAGYQNAPVGAPIDTLESLIEARLAHLETGIALRRTGGYTAARDYVLQGGGRPLMGQVRRVLASMESGQRELLAARQASEERHSRRVLWVLAVGSLLVLATTVATHRLLTGYIRSLAQLNDELEQKNDQLEEQAVELEMQAEELQVQSAQLEETLAELETANEELATQRNYLEEMAAELEASNDELLTANDTLEERTVEAEEANRAKSDFLATMSHELRTPLNAISGYAELLEMGIHGPVTEAQVHALGRIQRNQRYLLSLVNDILNFAKLEAGRLEVRVSDVPVDEVLSGLQDVVAPQMQAKGLQYACDRCEPALRMRGDRDRIEQILVNLLTNAIKFTESGGEVEVRCEADDEGVRIQVRDTGCGIPPQRLEEIFDPFVQVDRDNAGPQHGVGLGLAISRELARSMGGNLSVESTVGEGSTFTLTLLRGRRIATESIFVAKPDAQAVPQADDARTMLPPATAG